MTCSAPFIEVILKDGTFCRMLPKALDLMLRHDRVQKFRRSEGWALVGITPLRGNGAGRNYFGPERRGTGRCNC